MDLPSEIVLAILSPLSRPDLKSARLVSKNWSLCAAEFLFDVVYISPSKEDVDVFQAITQHPVLSKCPRHLEYDGAEFLTDYSKDKYAKDIWGQSFPLFDHCSAYKLSCGPKSKINAWIKETVLPNKSKYEDMESYGDCKVVDDGHRIYQEHANYQQHGLQSGQFVEILVRGLQHLVSLASVTVQPRWPLEPHCISRRGLGVVGGSPLARSWNIFHLKPCGWSFICNENERQGPDGAMHYLIITSALARARKQISKFELGALLLSGGVPPYVFDRSNHSSTGLDITVFSGLEHFDFTLAWDYDYKPPMIFEDVNGLQLLITSMDQLRLLKLRLSCDYREDPTFYTYEQVFSAAKVWSKLTTLELQFMSTAATDLLLLLVFQMPALRHLMLGGIKLLEGTWHSVIEGLKQSNRLSSFGIPYNTSLVHRSGIRFMSYNSLFLKAVREYMIHGGHHPCIPPNQPNHAAQNYMMDIEPSVRDRLVELDSTRPAELDFAA